MGRVARDQLILAVALPLRSPYFYLHEFPQAFVGLPSVGKSTLFNAVVSPLQPHCLCEAVGLYFKSSDGLMEPACSKLVSNDFVAAGSFPDASEKGLTHHDARPFRGRIIEKYDHLCIIFGSSYAIGGFSTIGDDFVHGLAGDLEGMKAIDVPPIRYIGNKNDQDENMTWTSEMDCCLSGILVEQVILGNKSELDSKFNHVAYNAAVFALNDRLQLHFTKDNVRNRIKMWKKLNANVKERLDQDEFRWDEKQKIVTAEDSVWKDYIEINPEVRLLKGRIIENYADLYVILGSWK